MSSARSPRALSLVTLLGALLFSGCGNVDLGFDTAPPPPPPPPPPPTQTVVTGFEDVTAEPDGSFTIGTGSATATFTGGELRNDTGLARAGVYAWHVAEDGTGEVTFGTPPSEVDFWFRNERDAPVVARVAPAVSRQVVCGVADQGLDNTEAFGSELFARGGFNDWGNPLPVAPYNFVNFGGGEYQAEFEVVAGTYEFKIADAGWALEYSNEGAEDVVVDVAATLPGGPAVGAANSVLVIAEDGCYHFEFVADTSAVPSPSAVLTVTKVEEDGGNGEPARSVVRVLDEDDAEIASFTGTTAYQQVTVTRAEGETRIGRIEVENLLATAAAQAQAVIQQVVCGVADQGLDNTEAFGSELFARGGFNDWGNPLPVAPYNFVNFGGGEYQAEFEVVAGTYEFKIADAGWALEYSNEGAEDVVVDVAATLPGGPAVGAANSVLVIAEDGCYHFEFVADTSAVPSPSAVLTVTKVEEDNGGGGGGGGDAGVGWVSVDDFEFTTGTDGGGTPGELIATTTGLTGFDQVPLVSTHGSGRAELQVDSGTGEISGSVVVAGLDVTSVQIRSAAAGANGPVVITLVQDANDPSLWHIADGTVLDAAALAAFLAGELYISATSEDFPDGEIRGQILPPGVVLLPDNGDIEARSVMDEVFYFVMTDRFANGDPANDTGGPAGSISSGAFSPSSTGAFHGGDFVGLTDRLDYIQGLGVTAIWVTPPVANQAGSLFSAGYHGYWGVDFDNVDPHFGTNAEFAAFVDAAHARGIKVYQDIVVNHTGDVITYAEGQFAYRPLSGPPYTPVVPGELTNIKSPDWLDDPVYYNNRGNTTFSGESTIYGDFFGLDDLDTRQQFVIDGMIDLYGSWIADYGVDGFRIDTARHVNMELWQQFAPAILDLAEAQGKPNFSMFGEDFTFDVTDTSRFTTTGRLPSVLDFPLHGAILASFGASGSTDGLRGLFEADDYYADGDSDARMLANFIGNHDIGRIGYLIDSLGLTDSDAQRFAVSRLAHAMLFFVRGAPIIYYGDEQGFTGDGGDQAARQDMMASQVASYNDDDLIGTDATTADENFDLAHPLYRSFGELATLRKRHEALRRGVQLHRYSEPSAGLYALSRVVPETRVEYLVVFNTATSARSASILTDTPDAEFFAVWPPGDLVLASGSDGGVELSVDALDFVIYAAGTPMPEAAPVTEVAFTSVADGASASGRVDLGVALETSGLTRVRWEVSIDGGPFDSIGEDYQAPYRIFWDSSSVLGPSDVVVRASLDNPAGDTVSVEATLIVDNRVVDALTVHYENGNVREQLVVLAGDGAQLGPFAVSDGTNEVALAGVESDLTLIWEDRDGDSFSFDAPLYLTRDQLATLAVDDGSGHLLVDLYVNNDHAVAGADNFTGAGAPPVLAEDPGAPAPFGATELFARGSFNGWEASDALSYAGNYTYHASLTLGSGDIQFKVADAGWSDAVNFGAPITAGGMASGGGSGDLATTLAAADVYDFYFFSAPLDGDTEYRFYHLLPTDAGTGDNPFGVPVFVRGTFNDWGLVNLMSFDAATTTFTATLELGAAVHQFKIASEDWSTVDYGGDGVDNDVELGVVEPLTPVGANLLLDVASAGAYEFTFDASAASGPTILIEAQP